MTPDLFLCVVGEIELRELKRKEERGDEGRLSSAVDISDEGLAPHYV